MVRFQGPLLLLERLIALGRGPAGPLRRLMRRAFLASHGLATRRVGPHSSVAGFLNTVRPSGAVVEAVDGVIADFAAAYEAFSRESPCSGIVRRSPRERCAPGFRDHQERRSAAGTAKVGDHGVP